MQVNGRGQGMAKKEGHTARGFECRLSTGGRVAAWECCEFVFQSGTPIMNPSRAVPLLPPNHMAPSHSFPL
jgi:hypothetical protein